MCIKVHLNYTSFMEWLFPGLVLRTLGVDFWDLGKELEKQVQHQCNESHSTRQYSSSWWTRQVHDGLRIGGNQDGYNCWEGFKEEEGLALQEVRDSRSACASGAPVAPGCILAVVEDAENPREQCVPQKRVRLYCWTACGSKAAELERKWWAHKKMKQKQTELTALESGRTHSPPANSPKL